MLNESLESFCTLSWDNSDVLPYRTGQSFKIVLCLSTWKVFHAFYSRKIQITTLQVYSHIYFLFLVPVNTRIYLISMPFPLQKKKKKELAFWLILPSSEGKKISHCLFLSKIIQIVCFKEEINCHFLQDLGCCLLLMRCHSWLHAYRILIWSYFSSYLFFFSEVLHWYLPLFKRIGKVLLMTKISVLWGIVLQPQLFLPRLLL